MVDFYLVL